MALTFEQVVAGAPPTGGDTGLQFATKINNNFAKLTNSTLASGQTLSSTTQTLYGVSDVDDALQTVWNKTVNKTNTVVTLTSSQTWTPPANIKEIDVIMVGAGGGGASGGVAITTSSVSEYVGSGGFGGNIIAIDNIKIESSDTLSFVIGSAGTGGAAVSASSGTNGIIGNAGIKGGDTSLTFAGQTITATGGEGGMAVMNNGSTYSKTNSIVTQPVNFENRTIPGGIIYAPTFANGNPGGVTSKVQITNTFDIVTAAGGNGGYRVSTGTTVAGGPSNSGSGAGSSTASAGENATVYGCGGGGGCYYKLGASSGSASSSAGGNGGNGVVYIVY